MNNTHNNPFSVSNTHTQNTLSDSLTGLIERSIDPNVLERIQELESSESSNTTNLPIKQANPLRAKSGMYFRDNLKKMS